MKMSIEGFQKYGLRGNFKFKINDDILSVIGQIKKPAREPVFYAITKVV
ncbi:MAG: hypothetical protein ABIE07_03385 [Candidatus Zixiibacteriota bacterium]